MHEILIKGADVVVTVDSARREMVGGGALVRGGRLGCTLTLGHLHLYPNGARLNNTIAAAGTVGLRFYPTRVAMSVGESTGRLPPDSLVETEAAILNDCIRVIDTFHGAEDSAIVRVEIAPRSPFSVSRDLMRDAATFAREKGVMVYIYLAENDEDIASSQAQFGWRIGQYAKDLGWTAQICGTCSA